MNHLKLSGVAALLLVFAFFFNACEETTSPTTENPVINSLSSNSGYVGMEITINGTNFGKDTDPGTVRFGGVDVPAAGYKEWKETRVVVVIPVGAMSGKLVLINNAKSSNEVDFTVVPANPEPATELMATSLNETTIRLAWKKAPQADLTVFAGYELSITGGVPMTPLDIAKDKTTIDITNLEEGVVYTFSLKSKYTGNVVGTVAAEVMWSPARRFNEVNAQSIRLYESESDFGSGLDLWDPIEQEPRIYKVASGDKWDLGLYTRNNVIQFGPATSLPYNYIGTPQKTEIGAGAEYYLVNALDEALDNIPMNSNISYSTNSHNLDALDMKGKNAVVFLVRTEESAGKWNYAKVMVKKTGGQWLQGAAPNRYIEVEISFQKISDVPYAKTAGK